MKNLKALFIIISLLLFACGSAESDYNNLLKKYSSGDDSKTEDLHEKLLKAFSVSSYDSDKLFFSKNIIICSSGDTPEVVYPQKLTLDADESIDDNISFGSMNSKNTLLGNNKGFCVFNNDGDPVGIYKTASNEIINAMALRDDGVIFLSKDRLYDYSISSKTTKAFDKGDFASPYKKYFKAFIYTSEKTGALITGIAGSYYISVLDIIKGGVRVKNIDSSSFDLGIRGNNLYYLSGGTANWSVMKYNISEKNKSRIKLIPRLENIFFTGSGFIVFSEGKGRIENFSGEKYEVPQEWTVRGSCDDILLIEYEGKTYLIDFNILIQKLGEISRSRIRP